MLEKRLASIAPQALIADGSVNGLVKVNDATLFKVKQTVTLENLTQSLTLEVKSILDSQTIALGPTNSNLSARIDLATFTVASGAKLSAPSQGRYFSSDPVPQLTYETEPAVASRVLLVDKVGNKISPSNPLPVSFEGTVDGGSSNLPIVTRYQELEVQANQETSLISLTPIADLRLFRIDVSGENVATFRLKINGQTVSTRRTSFLNFNQSFDYNLNGNFKIEQGQTVEVTVLHSRSEPGKFEVSLLTS